MTKPKREYKDIENRKPELVGIEKFKYDCQFWGGVCIPPLILFLIFYFLWRDTGLAIVATIFALIFLIAGIAVWYWKEQKVVK